MTAPSALAMLIHAQLRSGYALLEYSGSVLSLRKCPILAADDEILQNPDILPA
jgi:hypothetical protein